MKSMSVISKKSFQRVWRLLTDWILDILFGDREIVIVYGAAQSWCYNHAAPELTQYAIHYPMVTIRQVLRVVKRRRGGITQLLKTGWEFEQDEEYRQSTLKIRFLWVEDMNEAIMRFNAYERMGVESREQKQTNQA